MNENDIQILLSLHNNRHEDLKAIRERQWKVITSSISVYMLVVGLVIQGKSSFPIIETIGLIVAVIVFWIGILMILTDLRRAYSNSAKILIRIEQCLKIYDTNVYTNDGKSLYPETWQIPIKRKKIDKFIVFLSFFALISILLLVLKLILVKV